MYAAVQILPFFGIRHLVLSPIGNSLTKLNMGAQLQTFPYPTASKSFLYSNAFMAKSGAQSLTFKSMMEKQTDNRQQTDKKKSTFLAVLVEVKSEPHHIWHGDRGPRARSCSLKTFGVQCIVSPLRGAENLRETNTLYLKSPNSITPSANPTKF